MSITAFRGAMYEFIVAFMSALLVGLAVTSGVLLRRRMNTRLHGPARGNRPTVDDAAIRAILEEGVLKTDEEEPLNLGEIEEEERRFWSENWDEPDEL
jgi:hypothetical protein